MTHQSDSKEASERKIFDGVWWTVELPAGWSAKADGECATFWTDADVGVLQISSAKKEAGWITDEDLKEFARERVARSQLSNERHGLFSGFVTEYVKGHLYWKEWWLRSGKLMIYVTYNKEGSRIGAVEKDVELILRSLKPI